MWINLHSTRFNSASSLTFLTTLSPSGLLPWDGPSPHLQATPICFLLGVHFQSAGWWNLEFRPPRVMRVLGLLKVPSCGPCHLPLFSLPVPHSPLCNNWLEPTSVFNSMFIWTALGKWKLSLKAGVLKQQHEYKQLYLTNKGIWREGPFHSHAGAVSLKICLPTIASWMRQYIIRNSQCPHSWF